MEWGFRERNTGWGRLLVVEEHICSGHSSSFLFATLIDDGT
jgi:hypothetical protein